MNYNAVIVRLENVRRHPNADKLNLAYANYEQVVIGLEHYEGEIGIFFPAGCTISSEFLLANRLYRKHPETGEAIQGGYIESNGRVRFQKFRKEISRGLWLPISSLDYLELKNTPALGTSFQELEGHEICDKFVYTYLLNKKQNAPKIQSEKFELFERVGDPSKLVDNLHRLKAGDVLFVTEKMHGTSGRTGNVPLKEPKKTWIDNILLNFGYIRQRVYEIVSGTRRTILAENPYHADDDYRKIAHNVLTEHLERGQVVYYEIVGPGIMPNHSAVNIVDKDTSKELIAKYGYGEIAYNYGIPNGCYEIYIYKIVQHTVDGLEFVYSWPQLERWCNLHGLAHVPVLEKIIYDGDKNNLIKHIKEICETHSTLSNLHPMEGVVLQTEDGPLKHKSFDFCVLEDILPYDEPEELDYAQEYELSKQS